MAIRRLSRAGLSEHPSTATVAGCESIARISASAGLVNSISAIVPLPRQLDAALLLAEEAIGDFGDESTDLVAANVEDLVALLERIIYIARLAGERAQGEDRARGGSRKALAQVALLLHGHRDHQVGRLQQLRMALQVRRGRLLADSDADRLERHPGVERDQRPVARIG